MAKVKHIKRGTTLFGGRVVTQCGQKLSPDKVAPKGAPPCRTCQRDAGWFTPMRKR